MNAIILKGAALRQPPLSQSGPRAKTVTHPCPTCIHLLSHSYYITCPSHPPSLHNSNYTWQRVVINLLVISPLQPPVTSSHYPNSLFSNTPKLCSSLNVGEQVSLQSRTTGKIIVKKTKCTEW
jgi:hypothetical protein